MGIDKKVKDIMRDISHIKNDISFPWLIVSANEINKLLE